MGADALILTILIGAVAGYLAGLILKGRGLGLLGNTVVGVLGAIVGGWAFGVLGVHIGGGIVASLIRSVSGAVLLLFLIGLIRK